LSVCLTNFTILNICLANFVILSVCLTNFEIFERLPDHFKELLALKVPLSLIAFNDELDDRAF
jgi:hypothetical protein